MMIKDASESTCIAVTRQLNLTWTLRASRIPVFSLELSNRLIFYSSASTMMNSHHSGRISQLTVSSSQWIKIQLHRHVQCGQYVYRNHSYILEAKGLLWMGSTASVAMSRRLCK
ncbi:hypothetical protein T08_7582 [Trichinella sp. T8]|nr:hypothetical protein T08_7582 [Trichinella sp. T8]